MTKVYITVGSVRGSCGHNHRSLKTAVFCMAKDQKSCYRRGGYSDRRIEYVNGDGSQRGLYDSEHRLVDEFLK